jgi:hypothetical protein
MASGGSGHPLTGPALEVSIPMALCEYGLENESFFRGFLSDADVAAEIRCRRLSEWQTWHLWAVASFKKCDHFSEA